MNQRKVNVQDLMFGLAFLLALGIRLLFLGAGPLSDPEASWSLQALAMARGSHPLIGPQPAYVLLTGLFFFLFGSDNLLARLIPAVAGSLMVLAPCLVRDRIGKRAAVILSFGLAIDPALVALSRQADGAMIAISFSILALGFWSARKSIPAGISAGMAILGGPTIWNGLIGMALAWALYQWIGDRGPVEAGGNLPQNDHQPSSSTGSVRIAILPFLLTIILVGSLFFQIPRGLSAMTDSLAVYLRSWAGENGLSLIGALTALFAYEPLAILLGGWTGIRGWSRADPIDRLMGLWFALALVLALANPGRQIGDLGWALIPIWVLAARGIDRILQTKIDEPTAGWVYTAVVIMVIGFLWLNFTGFLVAWHANEQGNQTRVLAIMGGVILLVSATLLVAWGWSSRTAAQGLLRGGVLALLIYMIANTSASAGFHLSPTAEYWGSYPRPDFSGFAADTIGDLSFWRTGNREAIDVIAVAISPPSLQWFLRNYPQAQYTDQLAVGSKPSIVITQGEQQPALAASYRGQSLSWDEEPDWSAMTAFDRVNWIAFHQAPMKKMNLILWARTDIFLAGNPNPTGNP